MTKAAEQLNVSQPYLSRVISELESELNVRLFDHSGRGIVLNEFGKTFYTRAVDIISSVNDSKKETEDKKDALANEISVVTNIVTYIPGLLKSFYSQFPNIKVKVKSAPLDEICGIIQSGGAHFSITTPPLDKAENITSQDLMNEYASVIYPEGHWLEN